MGSRATAALMMGALVGAFSFAARQAHATTYLYPVSLNTILTASDAGGSDPGDNSASGYFAMLLRPSRVGSYSFASEASSDGNSPSEALNATPIVDFSDLGAGLPAHSPKGATQAEQTSLARLQDAVAQARMKLDQKDGAGAEEVLKTAVAAAPQSPQAALALGQLYRILKRPEKAETEIRRALRLQANYGPALLALGAIQIAGHRMNDAEQTYQRLDALPGKDYKGYHALLLFQAGKRDAALVELANLAKADPDDRTARTRLFAASVLMGKIPEARGLLAAALSKNPRDTDALLQRAELALKTGNAQQAEEDLKQVLHLEADSAQAHFELAEVYRARGLKEPERQELNQALQLNPEMLPARLALARNFLLSNKPKPALQILDEAPETQRTMLGVITERNWALFLSGNTRELRSTLDRVLRVGRYPGLLIQDAVLKMSDGDVAGARADADEVLRRNPTEITAAVVLADSYAAQKQPMKAIETLAKLAQGHPKSAPLQQLLGQQYQQIGKLREARKAFEAAKSADPAFLQADLSLADIDRAENHLDAARQHLMRLIAADPKNVRALLILASMEGDEGNRVESIKTYRTVLGIDRKNLVALNNLAYALAVNKSDEALKYALQAREIAPDNAAVEDTLGCVYYRRGNYREAVRYLKAAAAREPTPRRNFHLAMSYLKAGNREIGLTTLHAALLKDPNLAKTEQGW